MRRRSTYTPTNALRFKEVFDIALATKEDQQIKVQGSPNAFHGACTDALRYLIHNNDVEHDTRHGKHLEGDYAKLRGSMKVRQTQVNGMPYLQLAFAQNQLEINTVNSELNAKKTWLDLVREWVEGQEPQLKLKGLNLSAEDQETATRLLDLLEGRATYIVEFDMIVANRI